MCIQHLHHWTVEETDPSTKLISRMASVRGLLPYLTGDLVFLMTVVLMKGTYGTEPDVYTVKPCTADFKAKFKYESRCPYYGLPDVTNGWIDESDCSSYMVGGVCTISCDEGFQPAFGSQTVCESSGVVLGKWSIPENGFRCIAGDSPPQDCHEFQQSGYGSSGVYTIHPNGTDPFDVYCDMETDGGGWTVFQRREDGSVDFFLYWTDYVSGFGSIGGEHWLGNEKLYYLSNQKKYIMRVDLEDFEGESRYAVYDAFVIADASDNYRVSLGSYSGDAGGNAMTRCYGQQFSTRDQDNDPSTKDCAALFKGGWWYEDCHEANLNGLYLAGPHEVYAEGINWNPWKGLQYSLKFTEMKLRPV